MTTGTPAPTPAGGRQRSDHRECPLASMAPPAANTSANTAAVELQSPKAVAHHSGQVALPTSTCTSVALSKLMTCKSSGCAQSAYPLVGMPAVAPAMDTMAGLTVSYAPVDSCVVRLPSHVVKVSDTRAVAVASGVSSTMRVGFHVTSVACAAEKGCGPSSGSSGGCSASTRDTPPFTSASAGDAAKSRPFSVTSIMSGLVQFHTGSGAVKGHASASPVGALPAGANSAYVTTMVTMCGG